LELVGLEEVVAVGLVCLELVGLEEVDEFGLEEFDAVGLEVDLKLVGYLIVGLC
jgi:hypothetical protein